MLDQLYLHRSHHLDKYFPKTTSIPDIPIELSVPTHKEISSYLAGQLSLFPKDSGFTNLKWIRDKIEFIELFNTIHECKAITDLNGRPVTKKDFMQLVMWFFNLRIGHWQSSLNAGKERKVKKDSPFLNEMVSVYNSLQNKKL